MWFFYFWKTLNISLSSGFKAKRCDSENIMIKVSEQNKKPPNMYLVETEGVEPSSKDIGT